MSVTRPVISRKMKLPGAAAFFALLMAVLLLCGRASAADADELYYPLKAGRRWEYKVTSDRSDTKTLVITNQAPKEVNERTVIPRKWEMGKTVFFQLMGKDEGGVYRFAEQGGEKAPPIPITPKEYELKYPVTEGTTWDLTAKVGDVKVPVNLTIESVTDTVTVPAGTFKNCVKVKTAGEEKGRASVTAYEWYAPQVGVVKSMVILKRKDQSGAMTSESRTYLLQSFKP
jgi:hypothetical protein